MKKQCDQGQQSGGRSAQATPGGVDGQQGQHIKQGIDQQGGLQSAQRPEDGHQAGIEMVELRRDEASVIDPHAEEGFHDPMQIAGEQGARFPGQLTEVALRELQGSVAVQG